MDRTDGGVERTPDHPSQIITEGRVWSAVWYLAWPTAINTVIQSAYAIVNVVFVGRLPHATQALAAVGIGSQALYLQFAFVAALTVGTSALVARFLGAREHGDADRVAGQSLGLSVVAAVLTALPLIALASPMSAAFGARGEAVALAANYTTILAWFSIPMFLLSTITAALRAAGDVRGPTIVSVAVIVLNAILDWLLILGPGPFPQMGVHGAAIATSASRIFGMIYALVLLRRSVLRGSFAHLAPHWGWCKRLLNIGWPACAQNLVWPISFAALRCTLGALPAGQVNAAQAALTVALPIESLAFMPGVAYSVAAATLVGQNLGAGKPDRAAHTAWVATGQAVLIMAAVAVAFVLAPEELARAFTSEAPVVALVASYLRINAVCEPFLAVDLVLLGAMQGAGETRLPLVVSMVVLLVIRIPLTWLLSETLGYGASGAWVALSATTILSGILMSACFKWGRWRTVRV